MRGRPGIIRVESAVCTGGRGLFAFDVSLHECRSGGRGRAKGAAASVHGRRFFMEDRSYKEIEDATGFPLKLIKNLVQNGRRNLKLCLGKKGLA